MSVSTDLVSVSDSRKHPICYSKITYPTDNDMLNIMVQHLKN